MKWLFLVHQVRTRNSRERVRVWRLTKKVGAALYRNSVYVLPYGKERLEDFQWLAQLIRDSSGEAAVFISEAKDNDEDAVLLGLFEERSGKEFQAFLKEAGALLSRVRARGNGSPSPAAVRKLGQECKRLREEFATLRKLDFFGHPSAGEAERAILAVAKGVASLKAAREPAGDGRPRSKRDYQGKLWSTREHIHIDRLCSAWLIRRFIDPKARFLFAPEAKLPKHAIPFDVAGAEFSHHHDRCTFETLLTAFRIEDRALDELSQIVHDIDLKDQKYGRPEAAGVDAVVRALSASLEDDRRVLEVGSVLLDALYKRLGAGASA